SRSAARSTTLTSAAATTAAARGRATARTRGRSERRLRAEHLGERRVCALLVLVAAAHADGANELILDDDREAAADEVIREASLAAEIGANEPSVHGVETLRHRARGAAPV